MNKEHLLDLAFSFRETKLWKKLKEEELFAVRLSADDHDGSIGYCFVMGANGEHTALAVFRGARGFSTFREFCDVLISGSVEPEDVLIQDCMHCSLEQRDQLSQEELAEVRAYCRKNDKPVRAPFPKFTRYSPFCIPWNITDDSDWEAMETVLRVAEKMAEVIGRSGKAALGLQPVFVSTDGENIEPEQMDLFSEPSPDDEVTIPLYSIENDELVIDRIPLPPYTPRRITPPKHVNDKTLKEMKRRKQKGVYECELIRFPDPVEGEPPFFSGGPAHNKRGWLPAASFSQHWADVRSRRNAEGLNKKPERSVSQSDQGSHGGNKSVAGRFLPGCEYPVGDDGEARSY